MQSVPENQLTLSQINLLRARKKDLEVTIAKGENAFGMENANFLAVSQSAIELTTHSRQLPFIP